MNVVRRLLGGGGEGPDPNPEPVSDAELEEAERRYELEVARGEAERLTDLQRRQLKYADRVQTPPRQGGERRADDEDAEKADEE